MLDLPPSYETSEKVREERLNELQHQMSAYDEVQQRGDAAATEAEAQRVASAMRSVGDSQNDPKVKQEWYKKAEKFTRAANSARKGIFKEVRGIVGALLSIPFRVTGVALSIVGRVLNSVGGAFIGVGDIVGGKSDKVTEALARKSRGGNPTNEGTRRSDRG
jgi:hypothetical protein